MTQRVLRVDHPKVSNITWWSTPQSLSQRKRLIARSILVKALQIREESFGENHSETALCVKILATNYTVAYERPQMDKRELADLREFIDLKKPSDMRLDMSI